MLMGCLRFLWLLVFLQVLIYLSTALINTPFELLEHFCKDDTGNYTNNSVYRSNLDAALSSITSNINVAQFNDDVGTLFVKIRLPASGGGTLRKFATGNVTTANLGTIYGLVQCTPNLSEDDCNNCLSKAVTDDLPQCCVGRRGGKVGRASCNIRYEMNRFFMDTPTHATAPC